MARHSVESNLWGVLSDALRSPIAALATSNLTISLLVGAAFITNKNELAWPLVVALLISLVSTFAAVIRAKRGLLSGRVIRHHEPEFIKGSRKVPQNPGLGYRLEEHYNTELDPTISYIKTFVGPNTTSTWHQLRDQETPIEARFYMLEGDAQFELLNPRSRRRYVYDLTTGDSLLVPDSFWRRFRNKSHTDVLEMMVICMPRWRIDAFESYDGEIYELPS